MRRHHALLDYEAYCQRLKKCPLEITAYLKAPLVVYQWLFFDGILAFAVVDSFVKEPLDFEEEPIFVPLPLERRGEKEWYWAASVGLYAPPTKWAKGVWLKNYRDFTGDDYGFGVLEYDYRMPYPILVTPAVRFYAFGNKREVENLLKRVTHIGKKRAYGYGAVREWVVKTIKDDRSEFVDNILVRPLPVSECPYPVVGPRDFVGFRPPYWHPENFTECYLPKSTLVKR